MSVNNQGRPTSSSDDAPFDHMLDQGFWEMDRNLPRWARRSNPIVRRHLGGFFGAPIPQLDILVRLYLVQAAFVLVSFLIPAVLELTALMGLISFIVLPIALGAYGQALFLIGKSTVEAILDEKQTHALDTLLTTPLTLRSILLSKIAAGLWQQAVNLDTIILAAAIFSLPPVTIEYASLYSPEQFSLASRLLILVSLATAIVRVFVEPLMIGAVGILVGSVSNLRLTAIMWTTMLSAAYFMLINLPRLMRLTWPARLIVESILPVVLPVIITVVALGLARLALQRD